MTQATNTDVVQIVTQYFKELFGGNQNAALDLSSVDLGADFGGLDVTQIANQCAADSPLGHDAKQALSGYAGGSPGYPPPPPPARTVQEVVQSVQQVTQVVYQDNDTFNYVDNSRDTEIDNSVNVDGPNFGDIDVTNENNVASGDGSQVIDGDNFGTAQANSGDGAIQAGDDVKGANTGVNTGVIAGEDGVLGDDNILVDDSTLGQGNVLGDNTGFAGGINASTGGNTGGDASGTGGSGFGGFGGDGGDGGGGGGGLFGGGGGGAGGAGGSADGTGGSGFGGAGGNADSGDINIDLGGFGSGDRTNVENSNLNESQVTADGDNEQTEVAAEVMPLDHDEPAPDPAVTLPPPPQVAADVMPDESADVPIQ